MTKNDVNNKNRIKWWSDARYGMFIHWGVYSALSGFVHNGKKMNSAEWVMLLEKIGRTDYEKFAASFNPTKFNAYEWVKTAREAGMKYIVYSAKHHDGFAMYNSKADKYNISKMTSFHRDPLKELADECRKQDIKLCIYYSHEIDWHHPHGCLETAPNDWDAKTESKNFNIYWNTKVIPQISEILYNYAPISLIWFDAAFTLSREKGEEMMKLVRRIQPDCLINSRVCEKHDVGCDYISLEDRYIPPSSDSMYWETPCTINDTFGYEESDINWKSSDVLLKNLVDIAGKGGNYLLNVGPNKNGEISEEERKRLHEAGAWLKKYGNAVYKTRKSPFSYEMEWGVITVGKRKLYLNVFNWPKEMFKLRGLTTKTEKAYICTENGERQIDFRQIINNKDKEYIMEMDLPTEKPQEPITVIVLECEDEPEAGRVIEEQNEGSFLLNTVIASGKTSKKDTAEWEISVNTPGIFNIELSTYMKGGISNWEYKNRELKWNDIADKIELYIYDDRYEFLPVMDRVIKDSRQAPYGHVECISNLGCIELPAAGLCSIKMKTSMLEADERTGRTRHIKMSRLKGIEERGE